MTLAEYISQAQAAPHSAALQCLARGLVAEKFF
jgi:hypothetical protein